MVAGRGTLVCGSLAALSALTACSSSSTATTASLCRNGIDTYIDLRLDAVDKTLPLDIRVCVQNRPCLDTQTDGRNAGGQPGIQFPFTLDDHHQIIDVPVSILITSKGNQVAAGTVHVPVLQDYVTDGTTHKSANCGGRGAISVSRQGKLTVLPREPR